MRSTENSSLLKYKIKTNIKLQTHYLYTYKFEFSFNNIFLALYHCEYLTFENRRNKNHVQLHGAGIQRLTAHEWIQHLTLRMRIKHQLHHGLNKLDENTPVSFYKQKTIFGHAIKFT